jgi:group I intron endonuclease
MKLNSTYLSMLFEEVHTNNLKQYGYISGVYCIYNSVTDTYYIGSSESLKNRLTNHLNNSGRNKTLKNDFTDQNGEGFQYYLLERVSILEDLRLYEQLYLNYFLENNKQLYNIKNVTCQKGNIKKHLTLTEQLKEILKLKSDLELNKFNNLIDTIDIKDKPFTAPVYKKLKNLYTYYPVIRESIYNYIQETYINDNNIQIVGEVRCYKNDDWFNIFRLCYKVNDQEYLILNTDLYNLNKLSNQHKLSLYDTVYRLLNGDIKTIDIHSPYISKQPL